MLHCAYALKAVDECGSLNVCNTPEWLNSVTFNQSQRPTSKRLTHYR